MSRSDVTPAMHKRLIDAANLLAEFANQHLPDGFQIDLCFNYGECWLNLTDGNGDEIDVVSGVGISHFAEACFTAQDVDEEEEPTND